MKNLLLPLITIIFLIGCKKSEHPVQISQENIMVKDTIYTKLLPNVSLVSTNNVWQADVQVNLSVSVSGIDAYCYVKYDVYDDLTFKYTKIDLIPKLPDFNIKDILQSGIVNPNIKNVIVEGVSYIPSSVPNNIVLFIY